MNDQRFILFAQRREPARGLGEWFIDLARGDLVAWSVCLVLVVFVAVIAALGAWFLYQRKKSNDAFKKGIADKRKQEGLQYKKSKKTKDI